MTSRDDSSITSFSLPVLKDLSIGNITENVIRFNSQGENPRTTFLFEKLVQHLHDFARETHLSTTEWRTGLEWLEACGKISTGDRKELITVSDILGLSALVDAIDHPKPPGAAEGTILGPFHTLDAEAKHNGEALSRDPNGEPLFVLCTVTDTKETPISGVRVHVWEADSHGEYDIQKPDRPSGPDGRGVLHTNTAGEFYFNAIVPVSYPILCDGPVGKFLGATGRHPYRPAHIHFMFEKAGYENLITALYLQGSEYEASDAVFGVKESLVVKIVDMDEAIAIRYNRFNVKKLLKYNFVLASSAEVDALRSKQCALQKPLSNLLCIQ